MNATQEQLDALTVPATLPGVVRRGTPVRPTRDHAWHDARGYPCSAKADSVVRGAPCSGYPSVYLCDWGNTPIANCLVDLTDATGRAHVAWAVAADRWVGPSDLTAAGRLGADCMEWDGPSVPFFRLHSADPRRGPVGRADWAPLVAHLDPTDDTRLPDGSRLVDALALQAVALHVLGTGEVPAGPERSQGGA